MLLSEYERQRLAICIISIHHTKEEETLAMHSSLRRPVLKPHHHHIPHRDNTSCTLAQTYKSRLCTSTPHSRTQTHTCSTLFRALVARIASGRALGARTCRRDAIWGRLKDFVSREWYKSFGWGPITEVHEFPAACWGRWAFRVCGEGRRKGEGDEKEGQDVRQHWD
jgi:hypothetical protein